jgi:phytoene synthase
LTALKAGTASLSPADIAARVRAASSSFYWAMRLLPGERRRAIFAVYAFCREVDDIADEPGSLSDKLAALDAWRGEIDAVFAGEPHHPVGAALAAARTRFDLRRDDLLAVIDGMEMDACGPIVAPEAQTLDLYCDRVAAAVGRSCVRIFGEGGEAGLRLAHHLGRALQLTNIARDVAEDAASGRLYLPRDILTAHGLPPGPPEAVMRHPRYPAAWRALAARAAFEFAAADQAFAGCDARRVRPARIMGEIYRLNLQRMMALDDAAIADPAVGKRRVGRLTKLAIALRHGLV